MCVCVCVFTQISDTSKLSETFFDCFFEPHKPSHTPILTRVGRPLSACGVYCPDVDIKRDISVIIVIVCKLNKKIRICRKNPENSSYAGNFFISSASSYLPEHHVKGQNNMRWIMLSHSYRPKFSFSPYSPKEKLPDASLFFSNGSSLFPNVF